jgi:triacylglycerol lipase
MAHPVFEVRSPERYRSRVRQIRALLAVALVAVMLLAGCGGTRESSAGTRAVVVVSGGGSVSPFTTQSQACTTGLAASATDTAIREHLLKQGYQVYTAPMTAGPGPVTDNTGFGAFGNCPVTLPEIMTIDTTRDVDLGGEHLARFLTYLHTEKGVNEVDLIGHSFDGMWSRAAIHVLSAISSPVRIRSLTTLGTPWQGVYLADFDSGAPSLSDCLGDGSVNAWRRVSKSNQSSAGKPPRRSWRARTAGTRRRPACSTRSPSYLSLATD